MRAKPLSQKNFLEIQRTEKNFPGFQSAAAPQHLIKKNFRGNSRAEHPQAKKKFSETRLPVGGIFKTCRPVAACKP